MVLNILIAEDSPSIAKMTSMLLVRQGHTVCTAENGAIAVAKYSATLPIDCQAMAGNVQNYVQDEQVVHGDIHTIVENNEEKEDGRVEQAVFDVILMDLQMPVMDGLESVTRIRSMEKMVMEIKVRFHFYFI